MRLADRRLPFEADSSCEAPAHDRRASFCAARRLLDAARSRSRPERRASGPEVASSCGGSPGWVAPYSVRTESRISSRDSLDRLAPADSDDRGGVAGCAAGYRAQQARRLEAGSRAGTAAPLDGVAHPSCGCAPRSVAATRRPPVHGQLSSAAAASGRAQTGAPSGACCATTSRTATWAPVHRASLAEPLARWKPAFREAAPVRVAREDRARADGPRYAFALSVGLARLGRHNIVGRLAH